jgi:hypothetical protein
MEEGAGHCGGAINDGDRTQVIGTVGLAFAY